MKKQHFYIKDEVVCDEPLHYYDCGLDNIYLMNGFSYDVVGDEKYLTVTDIDGLHSAIGLHIVLAKKAPTGKELRFLRNELNYSQAELSRVLDVSDQSVARWEKGQCEVNGAAVFALRVIYLLSLVPDEEREELMKGLLTRLNKLMNSDETTDDIVMSYSGEKWLNPTQDLVAA